METTYLRVEEKQAN